VPKGPVVALNAVDLQIPEEDFRKHQTASQPGLPEVYLHPGQSHVAGSPVTLKMILGSCAGVFFVDPTLGLGGATHFMLPWSRIERPSPRYGDVALAGLLEKFLGLGSNRRNIRAKVFGGACILAAFQDIRGRHIGQIGERNVACAMEILTQERIMIADKNVLGTRGRKVSMVSPTGEVTLEFLSNTDGNR
jgi:chemotaxis protein CheD